MHSATKRSKTIFDENSRIFTSATEVMLSLALVYIFLYCLLARLPKNYSRWKEDTWTREETIRFWW